MKKLIFIATYLLTASAIANTYVDAYIKSDGTYVQPH
jgi:hypothetical protein